MVNTKFSNLGSESILSGHINGIQYSLNNVEDLLDFKTTENTAIDMLPVNDMGEVDLRYRIYEATVRGWVDVPAPVIYRNGTEVPADEYSLQVGYGLIIFNTQQSPDDVITAKATVLINESKALNKIKSDITTLQENAGNSTGDVTTEQLNAVKDDVTALQSKTDVTRARVLYKIDNNGELLYNAHRGVTFDDITYFNGVLSSGQSIDLFPIYIEHPVEASSILTYTSTYNVNNSNNGIFGIYTSLNGIPHELVAQSDTFAISGKDTELDKPMTRGKDGTELSSPAVLSTGLYYVARYNSYGIQYYGLNATRQLAEGVLLEITAPKSTTHQNSSGSDFYSGYRVEHSATTPTENLTELPSELPKKLSSTFRALARNRIQEIYITPASAG